MNMITDEKQLLSTLERTIEASDTYANSEVGEQRDRAHRYYYGEPLGNELKGRSQHVSMDVFDAVEAVKAMLLETFSADKRVCRFDPQSPMDYMPARMATELTNYIFYRQNNGYKILTDVIHDGLVAKTGIVKRYWKEDYAYDEEIIENVDEATFAMITSDPSVEIRELQEMQVDGMPPMYSARIMRRIDKSKVCVECVEPEDFLISPRAKDIESSDFVAVRTTRTRGELMEEGYDPQIIEMLDEEDHLQEDGSLGRDSVDSYRRDATLQDDDNDRQYVTVYESYLKKHDDELNACVYYKVIHARRHILDMEIVSEMPFRAFCPFPLPHRFYGMSLADVIVDLQKTMSSLKRGVVDHMFLTTTSRWVANLALVKNPRDLLDNRVGAVIDVNSPNPESVVRPLPTPQLNGNVYSAIESMEQEKEARSGASRMSRGLDSTVVSKQNSSDLITQFMNASNRRIMVMARNFAENFLKPLMHDLYRLAVQYERQEKMLQLDDQFVPVNPALLGDRTEMTVAVALTPDEQMREAQFLLSLDQQFSMNPADPSVGGMYGPAQRHALLSRVFEQMGIKGSGALIMNPGSPEYQQMMQQQQQAAEMQQQQQQDIAKFQAGMQARQIAVLEGQLELDVLREQNRFMMETEKQKFEEEIKESEMVMEAQKHKHDMKIRDEELDLEKQQNRNVSIGG